MIAMALTPRQLRFVLAYVGCQNAAQGADEAGYSERTAKEQGVRGRRVRNLQARGHAPTPRHYINESSCAREKFLGDDALEGSLFTEPPTPVKSVVISRSHSRSGQLRC
jgi:Terminase small subunit